MGPRILQEACDTSDSEAGAKLYVTAIACLSYGLAKYNDAGPNARHAYSRPGSRNVLAKAKRLPFDKTSSAFPKPRATPAAANMFQPLLASCSIFFGKTQPSGTRQSRPGLGSPLPSHRCPPPPRPRRSEEMVRCTVASAGNDHRLGAQEAPPAIISLPLGEGRRRVAQCPGSRFLPSSWHVLGFGCLVCLVFWFCRKPRLEMILFDARKSEGAYRKRATAAQLGHAEKNCMEQMMLGLRNSARCMRGPGT